jgi:hypothetical protein
MSNEPCPTGAPHNERENNCPFRSSIAVLVRDVEAMRADQTRLENERRADRAFVDGQLATIMGRLNGNGRPGLLDEAKAHADRRADEVAEDLEALAQHVGAKFEVLVEKIGNMKVVVALLAAAGAGAGGGLVNYILGAF